MKELKKQVVNATLKNKLVRVDVNENQEPVVSARELYEVLEVKTRYNDWFNRMREYGFVENQDFVSITQKRVTAQGNETTYIDHAIKLDMAKEIAMIQRSDKGKEVRKYFIQVEKDFNSPEKIMARALKIAENQINSLKIENTEQKKRIEQDKPKVIFADAVSTSKTSILIGELAKILKQNGVNTGEKRLFEQLRNDGYLIKRKGTDYNSPTQKAMELCLFEVKETCITHADGHTTVNKTTKVTGRGQQYFINKFLNNIVWGR